MSNARRELLARRMRQHAMVFTALGDETRLTLLERLSRHSGESLLSISRLTDGMRITRQAITKHLRVLEEAGLVRGIRRGRESHFELNAKAIDEAQRALQVMSRQWDDALARLKAFVEE
jgi:DNA-binding transcriptional ArsR family regulator